MTEHDALQRIWDIVHTPTKSTSHRSADRHFMADFDAIRQIIKDARAGAAATPKEYDWLLSSIIALDALARGGKLSNENVLEITKATLARVPTVSRPPRQEGS